MRYVGIIVTAPGIIIVARTSPNRKSRPRNRKCANPHATRALEIVTVTVASTVTITVFVSHSAIGDSCHTRTCLSNVNVFGIRRLSKTSLRGLNEALPSHTKGYTNASVTIDRSSSTEARTTVLRVGRRDGP